MGINEAVEYAKLKHGNQKRKHGTPYYTHPVAVAEMLKQKGFSEDYQIAGIFHDLLEDTDATYEDILNRSNKQVAEAVRLVTKEDGYSMQEYIDRIKENDMARMVKLADRIHNLSESFHTSTKFKQKYVKETKEWFLDLAKGTVFERDLNAVLLDVINSLLDYERSECK